MREVCRLESTFCFVIFLIVLFVIRVIALQVNSLELYADEAQYWAWAQYFDFGYYSKPPMVAWVIALSTYFLGDGELAVRIMSPILHFTTTIIVYFIGKNFGQRIAVLSGYVYATMPAIFVSSMIISTDPLLLLFWALALHFFIKGVDSNRHLHWLLCGLSAGLGMLSKYNMLFFLFSALLYLFYISHIKKLICFKKFALAIIIAFLVFLPNLVWNITHMFMSFLHTIDLVQGDNSKKFNLLELGKFFIAQFGVFGPINFILLLIAIFHAFSNKLKQEYMVLFFFSAPILLIMLIISFISRAHANWAAPIYISASILVVLVAKDSGKLRWLKLGIGAQCLIGLALIFHQPILKYYEVNIPQQYNAFKRMSGGRDLGEKVITLHNHYPNTIISLDTRRELSLATYYSRGYDVQIIKWNPTKRISDYYAFTTDANKFIGEDILLLLKCNPPESQGQDLQAKFQVYAEKVTAHEMLNDFPQYSPERYCILHLQHFKGY